MRCLSKLINTKKKEEEKMKISGETTLSLRKLALLGAVEQPVKLSALQFAEMINSSGQTAARRLQELEREGFVHRRITADGQWIVLTKTGIVQLKEECYEYQEIFFSASSVELEFVGRVITGLGEGKYYTTLEGYKRQFEGKLGFTPFPGTLNLRLDAQGIAARGILDVRKGIKLEGFESKRAKRTFGGGKCFPCKIACNRAEGVKSAVIIPHRTHYPEDVLEIISPIFLRCELKLNDGDEVRAKVVT